MYANPLIDMCENDIIPI